MTTLVRSLRPDVMIVQEAPRRFRWRSKCAQLARRFGLVYACGGLPSLGNLVLTNLRVSVHDTWCVQYPLSPGRHLRGAAVARCSVAGRQFAVAGTHLSTDPQERPVQAAALVRVLSEVDVPLVLGADLNDTEGSTAWRMVASGLTDAAVAAGQATTTYLPDRRAAAATRCDLRRSPVRGPRVPGHRRRPGPERERPLSGAGRSRRSPMTRSRLDKTQHYPRGCPADLHNWEEPAVSNLGLTDPSASPTAAAGHQARRRPGVRPRRERVRDRRRPERPGRDQESAGARFRRRLLRAGDGRRRRVELAPRPQSRLRQHPSDLVEAVHPIPGLPDAGLVAGLPASHPGPRVSRALRRALRAARPHLVRHRGHQGRGGRRRALERDGQRCPRRGIGPDPALRRGDRRQRAQLVAEAARVRGTGRFQR